MRRLAVAAACAALVACGRQSSGGGASLACYPVKTDDAGRVLVGFDMDFKPGLPSF